MPGKSKKDASELRRLKQQAEACRLRMMHLKESEIARILGVHQTTVSRWISEEKDRRALARDISHDEMRAREAARMEFLQGEAWRGWFRSLGDAVQETTADGGKTGPSSIRKRRTQSGNPSFLAQVIRASERLAALLGLDAPPQAKDPVVNASEAVPVAEVIITDQEQAKRLRDGHLVSIRADQIRIL